LTYSNTRADPRNVAQVSYRFNQGIKEICKARYEAFGSASQAGKIKTISLDDMAMRYAKGEFKAVVK